MKPLLPELATTQNFKFATPSQIREYADSVSTVAQLTGALDAWISHCDQILDSYTTFLNNVDADCRASLIDDALISDIAVAVKRLELETSFYQHFGTDEIAAVRRVLNCIPGKSKTKLERLDTLVAILKTENMKLQKAEELFEILNAFTTKDSSWTLMNCEDTLPPLFCALRAVYICCPLFGKFFPLRFSALVRSVLRRIEVLILSTLPPLLTFELLSPAHLHQNNNNNNNTTSSSSSLSEPSPPLLYNNSSHHSRNIINVSSSLSLGTPGVDRAVAGCLAAQSACIAVQEEFFKLRISVAEAVTREFTAVIYQGINEETVFSRLDFFYDRCVILLQLLTIIKQRKDEIFLTDGGICEQLLALDLLSPDQENLMSHEDLIDAIRLVADAPSMKPKDIMSRIENRNSSSPNNSNNHVDDHARQREAAAIRLAARKGKQQQQNNNNNNNNLARQQSSLSIRKRFSHFENEDDDGVAVRGTRVGQSNVDSNREWSLNYGDQTEQLARLCDRDPYFSIVFAFYPPRILITGIPLKPKQLELIAIKFQDALRSRVAYSAEKIRSTKMSTASVASAGSVLKAPYEKFRSAAEELADARYEAQERTLSKQERQLPSQQKNSNNNVLTTTTTIENELLQLRRYHVAAAHNAYMLDLPHSSSIVTDDEELYQSYAIQSVLDCLEEIEEQEFVNSHQHHTNNTSGSHQNSTILSTSNNNNNDKVNGNSLALVTSGSLENSMLLSNSLLMMNHQNTSLAASRKFSLGNNNVNNNNTLQRKCPSQLATTNAYTDQDGVHWSFFVFRYFPAIPKSRHRDHE